MGRRRDLLERVKKKLYPREVRDLADPEAIIRSFVIGAHAPSAPPISNDANIACIGSCFAEEIAKSLANQGKRVVPLRLSERWNTPHAVRAFIEHGLEGKPFPEGFLPPTAQLEASSFANLSTSTAFIITLGLSVCWFDLKTGAMVLDIKDGHSGEGLMAALGTHVMRQTTHADNVSQIEAIIACIRRTHPDAPIIFTVSPIPLFLSFTDEPSITANTVSKATIRVALHEVMRAGHAGVYYWPSYEMIEWIGKYVRPLWGQDGNDLRHLQPSVIDDIMRRFSEYYFAP